MAHNKKVKRRTRFNRANIVKNKKRIESTEKLISQLRNENINN
jgi:hypothetical protein